MLKYIKDMNPKRRGIECLERAECFDTNITYVLYCVSKKLKNCIKCGGGGFKCVINMNIKSKKQECPAHTKHYDKNVGFKVRSMELKNSKNCNKKSLCVKEMNIQRRKQEYPEHSDTNLHDLKSAQRF